MNMVVQKRDQLMRYVYRGKACEEKRIYWIFCKTSRRRIEAPAAAILLE